MSELLALIDDGDDVLLGTSPAAARLSGQVERVAGTPSTTVLLIGARGRELGLVAKAVHSRSTAGVARGPRESDGPFVGVDCAQLRSSGAHGAFAAADGLFARAAGGTLFLDEVAALDSTLQSELLEQLEQRAAAPTRSRMGAARLIASTARDLECEVDEGRFRADLFYRLNVLTVSVPTLCERRADVGELAAAILRRVRALLGVERTLSPKALEALRRHDWPGNLFELETTLGRAVLLSTDPTIREQHLGLGHGATAADALVPVPAASGTRSLRDVEEATIRRVLSEEEGNRSRAARVLGINRTTLYNKLRQYGIA